MRDAADGQLIHLFDRENPCSAGSSESASCLTPDLDQFKGSLYNLQRIDSGIFQKFAETKDGKGEGEKEKHECRDESKVQKYLIG